MSALKEQLQQWFNGRGFRAKHLRWEYKQDGHMRVVFATTKNNYFVTYKDTYLGMTVSSRLARPGEGWLRGNDLPDGSFSKETFDAMMAAMLTYELRGVSNVAGRGWLLRQDNGCVESVTATAVFAADGDVAESYAPTDEGVCSHGEDDRDCEEGCTCACHALPQ